MEPITFHPEWAPLLTALERGLPGLTIDDFMYMGHAGQIVNYKHRDTRCYLNICALTGRFYRYSVSGYLEISERDALFAVRGLA
jgi:hypothetical protein